MLKVDKGWGHELIWANEKDYCGKLLNFNAGAKFSMHFHAVKDETWLVIKGRFIVKSIDTKNATVIEKELNVNDTWHNKPLVPHQLICIEEGTIVEVSTFDDSLDNYRVMPGDSQK